MVTIQKMKSSSIWALYSMIKSMLNIKHGIDISKYLKLRAYLKKQNENYKPKKSKDFTKEQFERFLSEAPDEKYLGMKVVLIIGISGACRCDELVKMKTEDIEDLKSLLHVKISDSKTKKVRSFTVIGEKLIDFYRKYVSLRPKEMHNSRFFLKYTNGKCERSVMGIHTIGNVCRRVASYLNLTDCKEYTGHCLRRTSATLLVDVEGDITCLKRYGGWRSSSVAEGYIEESLTNKQDIARKIFSSNQNPDVPETSTSIRIDEVFSSVGSSLDFIPDGSLNTDINSLATSSCFDFQNASINNCTFNINMPK